MTRRSLPALPWRIHWALFILPFLAADLAFQHAYRRAYLSGCARTGKWPETEFYWKAGSVQLPLVALALRCYYWASKHIPV